jgi:hypothetical protein
VALGVGGGLEALSVGVVADEDGDFSESTALGVGDHSLERRAGLVAWLREHQRGTQGKKAEDRRETDPVQHVVAAVRWCEFHHKYISLLAWCKVVQVECEALAATERLSHEEQSGDRG